MVAVPSQERGGLPLWLFEHKAGRTGREPQAIRELKSLYGKPIDEIAAPDAQRFQDDVVAAARPVVVRGLAADWPVVQAGRRSPGALADYLRRFDRGQSLPTMFGAAGAGGRFFYNEDLSGFNFQAGTAKLAAALDYLLEYAGAEDAAPLAVQSVPVFANLSGFERENVLPLLPASVEPRVWLGNRVVVAAHHDPSENVAVVAAGRRRFTLFPPERIGDLYMGPFELTPAGTTISLVDFDAPDPERFPRFADALADALSAELDPGDAIYIPYQWWHHVRSTEAVNMLVNYWWSPPTGGRGQPRDAFLHALLAIKRLPRAHRAAWKVMFDHYVFETGGDPAAHIPPERRGVLGDMNEREVRSVRAALAKTLSRP